jgi:hypothetical protein
MFSNGISSQLSEESLFSLEEYRTYIKFRSLLGISAADIHRELHNIPGAQPPSERTVREWPTRFKDGRSTVKDDPRCSHPVHPRHHCWCRGVHLGRPHATVEEVAEYCNISHRSAHEVLTHHLRLRKICAHWVLHALTASQREERVQVAQSLLNRFRRWRKRSPPTTDIRPSHYQNRALYSIFFTHEGDVAKVLPPEGEPTCAFFLP